MQAHEFIRKIKNISTFDSIRELSYSFSIEEVVELMEKYHENELKLKQ